jgi:hypothetical protein
MQKVEGSSPFSRLRRSSGAGHSRREELLTVLAEGADPPRSRTAWSAVSARRCGRCSSVTGVGSPSRSASRFGAWSGASRRAAAHRAAQRRNTAKRLRHPQAWRGVDARAGLRPPARGDPQRQRQVLHRRPVRPRSNGRLARFCGTSKTNGAHGAPGQTPPPATASSSPLLCSVNPWRPPQPPAVDPRDRVHQDHRHDNECGHHRGAGHPPRR